LLAYSVRRILGSIPLLLGVLTLVFIAMSLVPGDPVTLMAPIGTPPEVLDALRHRFGLDEPFLVRYGKWLLAFIQGDFGYSYSSGMPVGARIMVFLPRTLILTGTSLILSFLIGILVGVVQGVKPRSLQDTALSGITLFFYSMPSFWLALMLILFLAGEPVGLPVSGSASAGADLLSDWEQLLDRIRHLILPVLTLTLILAGGIARYVRTSMLDVMGQDYIRTARAKGLPETTVIVRHGLRNGLIPVVTLLGTYLPFLLSGAVLVEVVFGYPGMGKLMVDAILERDYPVVLATSFLFAVLVVLGNLLADLLYGVVDPRIRVSDG
jgi:peptide/nickel transport system permease protein